MLHALMCAPFIRASVASSLHDSPFDRVHGTGPEKAKPLGPPIRPPAPPAPPRKKP